MLAAADELAIGTDHEDVKVGADHSAGTFTIQAWRGVY